MGTILPSGFVPWFNERSKHFNASNPYTLQDSMVALYNLMNSDIGEITSRDQIINPYEILDVSLYRNTAKGQALYQEDLNTLLAIQAQQQASYDEWYNSAAQQSQREREAGLNPNLLGNVSSGEVASTETPSGSPLEGVPTDADQATQIISGVTSIVSAAASVAALPASFAQAGLAGKQASLVGAQAAGQQLSNLQAYEGLIYASAAGQFADAASAAAAAGTAFDVDGFFSNPDSFKGMYEAYTPSDNPQYRAAYDRAIKQVQRIKGEGYKISGSAVANQGTVAEALSNPYYDPNLLLQVAVMEPVMKFQEDVRILNMEFQKLLTNLKSDVVSEVDAAAAAGAINAEQVAKTAEANFKSKYFENFDGDAAALYDMYQKKFEALRTRAVGDVYNNYWKTWKKDPLSTTGLGASYLITNGEHFKWYEYLGAFSLSAEPNSNNDGKFGFDEPQQIVQGNDTLSYPKRPFTLFDIYKNK